MAATAPKPPAPKPPAQLPATAPPGFALPEKRGGMFGAKHARFRNGTGQPA